MTSEFFIGSDISIKSIFVPAHLSDFYINSIYIHTFVYFICLPFQETEFCFFFKTDFENLIVCIICYFSNYCLFISSSTLI